MRILLHSNAPSTKTGYGVQCALLAERLHDAGHQVAISATYGQQGGAGSWKPENPRHPELWEDGGIRVYPCGWQTNGLDIIHNHALHWFDGDPLGGWIIPLLDVWCLTDNPLLKNYNVAAWTPVDHFPTPPGVLKFFAVNPDAVPVAMSQFGTRSLETSGLDAEYVPLAVDTTVYKPTASLIHERHGEYTGRQLMRVPDEAFLVGMVAMNKDFGDRKGFNEAFAAFGAFWRSHTDAVLYVHTDPNGMGTSFDLRELATHCGIPEHAIVFPDTYAYQAGFTAEMMAAIYTGFDVLLAPSHGEGFCVPLIEAQACGTPVIITDFSAQPELLGAGWKVHGQQQWDPAQHAFYIVPYIDEIVAALGEAYTADIDEMAPVAIASAARWDADRVFDEHWLPLLDRMAAEPDPIVLDRTDPLDVAVLVPALRRPHNVPRLVESLGDTGKAYYICDPDDDEQIKAVEAAGGIVLRHGGTFAEKLNHGFEATTQPWVFICGDDVQFDPDWLKACEPYASRFDVIGTNDSYPGRVRNPDVASGKHADHFLVRRLYVQELGSTLEGPGVLAPEVYGHFFTDSEIIELAKARGVFFPCLDSIVEHHHPAYDGMPRDEVYNLAVERGPADQETYKSRLPVIKMQRTALGRVS